MKTTLVIMAAGIGSRFGGGIKQLEPVGMNGEIIMDYSVHDAIEAGFNKVIFIIRKDIEAEFKEIIGNRMEALCAARGVEIGYAYQSLSDLPDGVSLPEERKKPWGTGQAVLSCKGMIHEPFVVINADDYYGKEAFVKLHDFLQDYTPDKPMEFCMAGFLLKNTLSENGGVTRGICQVDEEGYLHDIVETSNILRGENGIEADGKQIPENAYASMNMFGLTPEFMDVLEQGFADFFKNMQGNILKEEYLIPIFLGQLLREGKISIKALETNDKWFGVTYKEDKEAVVASFKDLIEKGVYHSKLWE